METVIVAAMFTASCIATGTCFGSPTLFNHSAGATILSCGVIDRATSAADTLFPQKSS